MPPTAAVRGQPLQSMALDADDGLTADDQTAISPQRAGAVPPGWPHLGATTP
jgi:hypothetical protein